MATFTNQATLTYNDITTNSNIVTGEIIEVLSAAKTAVTDQYSVGDSVTYVISIVNTGAAPVSGVSITDDLGAYDFGTDTVTPLTYVNGSVRYFADGVLQAPPTVSTGNTLTITGITVPANGNAVIVYETLTNEFAPPTVGSTITNTAVITGTGIAAPITVEENITAADSAQLSITKALSPSTLLSISSTRPSNPCSSA